MKILKIAIIVCILSSFLSNINQLNATHTDPEPEEIVFWTTEVEASRITTINQIASHYPNATVKVVPIDENNLSQSLLEAKNNGSLPDCVQVFYEHISGYVADNMLDPVRATAVIAKIPDLGGLPLAKNANTKNALDKYGAVPIDGWIQGIWYRTDLFAKANLAPPTNYSNILKAAKYFYNISDSNKTMYGIVIGTNPQAVYTQQVYEHIALANGAQPLNKDRQVTLNSPAQIEALTYYTELAQYGPAVSDWAQANELYLTNKSAMIFYSTFIADDIIGLQTHEWTPIPNLANITGFQASIEGFHNEKATYGQISALGICIDANPKTEEFIKFIMTNDTEYLRWINMALTGKMPLRQTPAIVANWSSSDIFGAYSGDLVGKILDGFHNIGRWGILEGKSFSTEITLLYTNLILPKAINAVLNGTVTPTEALNNAAKEYAALLGITSTSTPIKTPWLEYHLFLLVLPILKINRRTKKQ